MVVGVLGADGVHVLERVALEHSTAGGTAINQDQHMEGRHVLVKAASRENAIPISVQVDF